MDRELWSEAYRFYQQWVNDPQGNPIDYLCEMAKQAGIIAGEDKVKIALYTAVIEMVDIRLREHGFY